MRDSELRDLLRSSERTDARAPETEAVLAGVATHLERRQQRQRLGSIVASIALVAVLVSLPNTTIAPTRVEMPSAPQVAQSPAVSTPLDWELEAELRERVVRGLRTRQAQVARQVELQRKLDETREDPHLAALGRAQVELAAATLFRSGERHRSTDQPQVACRQFKQVVNLYPGTAWAQLAARRLDGCFE